MAKILSMKAIRFVWLFGVFFFVSTCYASVTYIPASSMSLTGANREVFFDVEDDIVNAGTSIPGPRFSTVSKKFSGAFYLTGAGWVDLGAAGYDVGLDCGAQMLDSLSSVCDITGTGYSETIGDIVFDRKVKFNPGSGLLSGTASTFIGDFVFDGIMLPLLPSTFVEGTGTLATNSQSLTISGSSLYGNGPWTIGFTPVSTLERRDISPNANFSIDLSLAADYDVEIRDPQGSITQFTYKVHPNIPSFVLSPGSTFRSDFCSAYPAHSYCQDGLTQKPSQLSGMGGSRVANGSDIFSMNMTFRDSYGNEIKDGDISVVYKDAVRTFQVDPMEYMFFDDYCPRNIDNYCALITGGALLGNDDGTPEIIHAPVLGGVSYTIASRAPTGASDILSLSGITYRDASGSEYDVLHPSITLPLIFTPWYTSTLSSGVITVGESTDFTPTLSNSTPSVLPDAYMGIYHINIGTNTLASYRDFLGENITCAKYVGSSGVDMCDWVGTPDTSIISLWGSAFSGVYTPYSGQPSPENVSYRSYVRYIEGGTPVIYPSVSASLGIALAGKELIKILGQDTSSYPGIGVDNALAANEWNILKKKVSLNSRGRTPGTGYSDVDFVVFSGSITLGDADFHGTPEKQMIVTIGGDINISGDISKTNKPLVIAAIMDENGNGGDIIIDPSVREISASLFAEKSVRSSGDNQLYILGNVFSHNTLSKVKCPYYVSGICDPTLYNLEQIRIGYLDLALKIGHTSPAPRAGEYPSVPLIIEYDGRLLQNPPTLLEN